MNTINPGPVSTGMWLGEGGIAARVASANGINPDDAAASAADGASTGTFTTPQQIADLAVFLASVRSGNTTGATVRVDGGYIPTL